MMLTRALLIQPVFPYAHGTGKRMEAVDQEMRLLYKYEPDTCLNNTNVGETSTQVLTVTSRLGEISAGPLTPQPIRVNSSSCFRDSPLFVLLLFWHAVC